MSSLGTLGVAARLEVFWDTIEHYQYMPDGPAKIWIGVRTSYKRMQVTDPSPSTVLDRRVLAGTISVQP